MNHSRKNTRLGLTTAFCLTASCVAVAGNQSTLAAEADQAPVINYTAKPEDRQIRAIDYHDYPDYNLRLVVDGDPAWSVEFIPNPTGKYPTVVARSPDHQFPPAELQVMPIYDVRLVDLGPDPGMGVLGLLKNMAPLYQLTPAHFNKENLQPARYGDLKGFRISATGAYQGHYDMTFFVADMPLPASGSVREAKRQKRGLLILTAGTLTGHLDKLEQVMRRSWGNTGVLSQE
jgi:hypothetical protein